MAGLESRAVADEWIRSTFSSYSSSSRSSSLRPARRLEFW